MAAPNAKVSLVAGVAAALGASVSCVGPLVRADPQARRRQRMIFWWVPVVLLGLLAVQWLAPRFY